MEEPEEVDAAEKDIIGGRDAATEFITHSDLKELATAIIAASVPCRLTDGVLFDDGNWIAAEQSIDWGREQISEVQKLFK